MIQIIGVLASFIIIVWIVIISGGTPLWFFDTVSLILVFGFTASVLIAGGCFKVFIKSFSFWLSKKSDIPVEEMNGAVSALGLACRAANGAGALGFTIGAIMALVNINTMSKVGPSLALSLLSLLYGMLLGFFVFLPMQTAIRKKIKDTGR